MLCNMLYVCAVWCSDSRGGSQIQHLGEATSLFPSIKATRTPSARCRRQYSYHAIRPPCCFGFYRSLLYSGCCSTEFDWSLNLRGCCVANLGFLWSCGQKDRKNIVSGADSKQEAFRNVLSTNDITIVLSRLCTTGITPRDQSWQISCPQKKLRFSRLR